MKKSINGWNFAPGTSWAAAARAARAAGFQAIEPTLEAEGELSITTGESACRRIGEQIREAGLEVASTACGLIWTLTYTSKDPAVRAKAHDLTLACLDRARWMGAPAILVLPGVVSHFETNSFEVGYADALKYALEALQKLSFEAEARNVIIAAENVWNNFLVSPVEMRDFIDRVNSPWVGAYFDTGNVLRYGIPEDWVQTLGKRIVRVHVKDFQVKIGNINGFVPLGDGDVNWPVVIAGLQAAGYDGPLTFEGPGDLADISKRLDRILRHAH